MHITNMRLIDLVRALVAAERSSDPDESTLRVLWDEVRRRDALEEQ